MNPLITFYRAELPDNHGRLWADIVSRDDAWLEHTHDYIQWLFPLRERSAFNADAPIVDDAVVHAFKEDAWMRQRLGESFIRMLRFYGLRMRDDRVEPGPSWDKRKHEWFVRAGHNSLRITRILKSLTILGLPHDASALLACLVALRSTEPSCGIDELTYRYWSDAVEA